MMRRFQYALAAAVLVTAVAASQQKPAWVSGKSPKHPAALYFTAVGEGTTREEAENRARAGISVNIRASVKSETEVTKGETLTRDGTGTQSQVTEQTRERVQVAAARVLEGVTIDDVWTDPAGGKIFALAVLDRAATSEMLKSRINELDTAILELREAMSAAPDNAERLKMMVRRKALMAERSGMNEERRIIDPAGAVIEAPYVLQTELAQIESFIRTTFKLGVEGKGEHVGRLVQVLTDSLAARGIPVAADASGTPDVLVTLELKMSVGDKPVNNWYEAQWELSLRAVNTATGKVIAANSRKNRSRQLTRDETVNRAVFDAGKALAGFVPSLYEELAGT